MYGSVSYCAYRGIVACCTVRSLRNGCRRKIHKANWLCLHMCARMRGFVCEEYSIIAYVYVFDVCITSCNYVCARVCACVYVCIVYVQSEVDCMYHLTCADMTHIVTVD